MTFSEENYLKSIYHLTAALETEVSTNAIAEIMETKASSVTDMLKKLAEKDLVNYKKYQGLLVPEDTIGLLPVYISGNARSLIRIKAPDSTLVKKDSLAVDDEFDL